MTPADVAVDTRSWQLRIRPAGDATLVFELGGRWHAASHLPRAADVLNEARATRAVTRVAFASEQLGGWDSGLIVFLRALLGEARRAGVATSLDGLPDGVRRLLSLATSAPEQPGRGPDERESLLARVGLTAIEQARGGVAVLAFLGEACLSVVRLIAGKARFRRLDFVRTLQEVGINALPIVALISFLVGVILAYVGAIQLRLFGAQIYVADLVGIAMAREMGAMMAAIIMAGRTGAAFAAQLGTMQVNEEIDAFVTMGIPPMDFLVLPRMLALALMMPLLAVYADVLGMVGGAAVGTVMLDLSVTEYYQRTIEAISLADFTAGAIKASVFGVLVAIAGCLRGIQSGRNAAAVGAAATSAVVTGIVLIISTDAILTIVFDLVGL